MSELSVMDYFITKTNDKVEMDFKADPDLDISTNFDNSEFMSSDFFDSILSLEKANGDGCELDSNLFDNLDVGLTSDGSMTYDDIQCETSTFSDSGLSSDQHEVADQILSDDELLKSILDTAGSVQPSAPTYTAPVNVTAPVPALQFINKPTGCVRPRPILTLEQTPKTKIINIIKPIQKQQKQVIRVQPLNGGNARSVLLPINIKDLKTIKIINTNNLKAENIKFTTSAVHNRQMAKANGDKFVVKAPQLQSHSQPCASEEGEDDDGDINDEDDADVDGDADGDGQQYPPLTLTPEEKRLLSKDGIQLPCRYPLTKHEERELKRIRRKIRNKISAQDSRKRKKEYVDGLEERVKQCSEENRSLLKRIKLLQTQNTKLSSQLSKLQALVFKTGTSRAHPATCLMIVLLSVMLVTLPNLRNTSSDKQLNSLQQFVARRALLFSQQATNEDTAAAALNMDELITFPDKVATGRSAGHNEPTDDLISILNSTKHKDNSWLAIADADQVGIDYGAEPDHQLLSRKRYIEPDIDDHWPPEKKSKHLSVSTTHLNRTEYLK